MKMNNFQILKAEFSAKICLKCIILLTNFQKSHLSFRFWCSKFRDLAKLWFFKLNMTKLTLKIIHSDVISLMSLLHQTNVTRFPPRIQSPIKLSGCASVVN